MATYHTELRPYSRGQGPDPLRHLAYVSGEVIYDERTGECHVSGDRARVVSSTLMLPEDAPEWAVGLQQDMSTYWNARNLAEDRINPRFIDSAAIYFEYVIALPRELTFDQNQALVKDLLQQTFHRHGLAVQVSYHQDEGNPHVHVDVDDRPLTDSGWGRTKHRYYTRRQGLKQFRATVAEVINTHYAVHHRTERVTHKSHKDRELDLEATLHEGPRGGKARQRADAIAAENAAIHARNVDRIKADVGIIITEVSTLKNVFTQKDLAATLLQRVNGNTHLFDALYPLLMAHPDLVPLGVTTAEEETAQTPGRVYYTTRAHQQEEAQLLATARGMAESHTHALDATIVDAVIAQGRSHTRDVVETTAYTEEQSAAIRALTQGGDLHQLHGPAGTGKTTVIQAVARAYQGAGQRVVGMALSGVAAQNLGQSAEIQAQTLHRWILDWNLNDQYRTTLATSVPDDRTYAAMMAELRRVAPSQLTANDVLVIDEAGMVGTKQLHQVLQRAEAAGAKVILIGDTAQLGAVDYGAPYRALHEHLDGDHQVALTQVYRQNVRWMREASEAMHTQLEEGLWAYKERGCVHEVATRKEAIAEVADLYVAGRAAYPDRSHVALGATRAAVVQLNHAIRQRLLGQGGLGAHIPEVMITFGRDFRVKDRVVLLKNAPRLRVREGKKVRDAADLEPVYNGDRGTIHRITVLEPNRVLCEVALDRGGMALVDSAVYPHLEYGYAVTVHKAQGLTVDHAYVYLGKWVQRQLLYVALTRHRHGLQVVYDQESFKDYGALERQVSQAAYAPMVVDYTLSEGGQQVANQLQAYLELITAMADYRKEVSETPHSLPAGVRLARDATYKALKAEQAKQAVALVEDWSPVHDRLCGQLRLNKQTLYRAAGIRTAYERDRERKVSFYVARLQSLRQEGEEIRRTMGAMPYRRDEPLTLRLKAIQQEHDHLASQLLSYRELKAHITAAGLRWDALERRAARHTYALQKQAYYGELSEPNRAKFREVQAFAQEAWVLGLQWQAMVRDAAGKDVTTHIAYDLYQARQQALNAQAQGFIHHVEAYDRLLQWEGLDLEDMHRRATAHRLTEALKADEALDVRRERVHHELEFEPALLAPAAQRKLGVIVPEWINVPANPEVAKVADTALHMASDPSSTQDPKTADLITLCQALRTAWDHTEAVALAQTMARGVTNTAAIHTARARRNQAAAQVVAAAADYRQTPFTAKQWQVIQSFAGAHRQATERKQARAVTTETLVQGLKDQMPAMCEALLGSAPSLRKGHEWRYGTKGSLKVSVGGLKNGAFVNFETGEKGGPLQLIMTQRQCDLSGAKDWARSFLGYGVEGAKARVPSPTPTQVQAPFVETARFWISRVPSQDASGPDPTRPELKAMYHRHQETARYTFTDATGAPLFHVVRFEPKVPTPDGPSKLTLPLSYGHGAHEDPSAATWRWKKYTSPDGSKTPLYQLKDLTDSPEKPILVVEGEKAAEVAQRRFPEMVVTTWQGGASSAHRSDWTPMQGRTVVIWPDNDAAGLRAAEAVRMQCEYAGAAQVAVVSLEVGASASRFPAKWDLADALPEGVTEDQIRARVQAALNVPPMLLQGNPEGQMITPNRPGSQGLGAQSGSKAMGNELDWGLDWDD